MHDQNYFKENLLQQVNKEAHFGKEKSNRF